MSSSTDQTALPVGDSEKETQQVLDPGGEHLAGAHDRVDQAALQALRASEARYRVLTHSTASFLFRISGDGTQMLEVHGELPDHPQAALSWAWLMNYVHPDDQKKIFEGWLQAVAMQRPYEMELRRRQADGSWGWVYAHVVPVHDRTGVVDRLGNRHYRAQTCRRGTA